MGVIDCFALDLERPYLSRVVMHADRCMCHKRWDRASSYPSAALHGRERHVSQVVVRRHPADGTIRHLMQGVDAQATEVYPFKKPSSEELDHDFLWRIHKKVPALGNIGIFNRSHYEDVLVVRVHNLVPPGEWKTRYERINDFEKLLTDAGVTILKFFLHISKEEQRERLQARLDAPNKRWKFSKGDLAERKLWNNYQVAYIDALSKCNTRHAPWHIICADRKWHRNLVVSTVVRRTLEKMNPQFPPAEDGLEGIVVK